jgi:radical SAM protein with 4Fe4S-binding SPASM domain
LQSQLERVQFHLTNKCNLDCIFCGVRNFNKTQELSDKKWIKLAKELCEFGPKQLTISGGGEPLIRMKLAAKIMNIVKSSGIEGAIITNGTLTTSNFAKKLVEIGWDEYRVSLHSPNSEMDKFLRGRESFFLTIKGIEKINYFKKLFKTPFPRTEIWMVLTRYNFMEIEKMIELAKKIEVNGISLKMVNEPNEEKKFSLSLHQLNWLKNNYHKYQKKAEEYEIRLRTLFSFDDFFSKKKNKITKKGKKNNILCLIPFKELVIFADGRVSPCCNFFNMKKDEFAIEDITCKSLNEVWFSEKFNKFRELMLRGDLIEKCKECPVDLKYTEKDYR